MRIDLIKYLSDRAADIEAKKTHEGPVITISREYGCPSKLIACSLAEEITHRALMKGMRNEWKFVTKEIISESARELHVQPDKIKYVFDYEHKGILDGVLSAQFSKYYKSDKKIINTVAKVIRNMAKEGHVIIVGRGGVAITRDIINSLHIMLVAPLEWRAARISENYNVSLQEAKQTAIQIDRKRKEFREYFQGKNNDYTWFDITLNCMTQSIDDVVKIITAAASVRGII